MLRSLIACLLIVIVPLRSAISDSSGPLQELMSKVQFYRLSNGIRVIMYDRGTAPVFSGAVVVRVGGVDENLGETGISHMFEHMAFKGTRTIGTTNFLRERDLLQELETIAAQSQAGENLSPEQKVRWDAIHTELSSLWITDDFTRRFDQQGAVGLNATTDKELTKYFVNLPRSAFAVWCSMESDRLLAPVLRQFYQERNVVLEERRMRYEDDPSGKLYETMLSLAYGRHPYRNPVIGYEDDIRSLTATMLDDFRRKFYVPENIVISIVGRVNPDEDIKVVERFFGSLPVGPKVSRNLVKEAPPSGERRFVVQANAAPQIMIGYHKPSYPHPDDPPISVMEEILAGGKVSPLYVELVQRKQVAAGIDVSEAPGAAFPNLFVFSGTIKNPHSADEFVEAFDTVIEKFKKTGPTEEQLRIAKRSVQMSFVEQLNSNQSLALDLASSELLFGSWRSSLEWMEKAMLVTVEDVKRVANQYLSNDTRVIGSIEKGA